jgi:hypothetical protein
MRNDAQENLAVKCLALRIMAVVALVQLGIALARTLLQGIPMLESIRYDISLAERRSGWLLCRLFRWHRAGAKRWQERAFQLTMFFCAPLFLVPALLLTCVIHAVLIGVAICLYGRIPFRGVMEAAWIDFSDEFKKHNPVVWLRLFIVGYEATLSTNSEDALPQGAESEVEWEAKEQ